MLELSSKGYDHHTNDQLLVHHSCVQLTTLHYIIYYSIYGFTLISESVTLRTKLGRASSTLFINSAVRFARTKHAHTYRMFSAPKVNCSNIYNTCCSPRTNNLDHGSYQASSKLIRSSGERPGYYYWAHNMVISISLYVVI